MIHCPFHDDRTPSLRLYETGHRGWFCFGCGRGGDVYDLAAPLLGLNARGAAFVELRQRLTKLFPIGETVDTGNQGGRASQPFR